MPVIDDQFPTLVTDRRGSPRGGARKGEVLGERYEIHDHLGTDAFTDDYRAIDQENDQTVLVHIVDPSLLPERDDASRTLKRLRAVIGYGGRYLPGIVSAEAEGQRVMAVEPWPTGTRLRDVLDVRASRAEPFTLRELLPVTAYLEAALNALPDGHRHGSVIAERIYVAEGQFRLAGGFLVAALPESAVSAVVGADSRLRLAFAPEVLQGGARRSSDLYSTACIVFEALFGRLPAPDEKPPASLGAVSVRLGELLRRDTYARPARLTGLVRAMAEATGLPIPELDPEKFDRRVELLRTEPDARALVDDDAGVELGAPATVPMDPDIAMAMASTDPTPFVEPTTDESYLEDLATEAMAAPVRIVESDESSEETQVRGAPLAPDPARPEIRRRAIEGAAREGTMEVDASQFMEAAEPAEADAEPPPDLDAIHGAALGANADDTARRPPVSRAEAPVERAAPRPLPVDRTGEIHERDLELLEESARALAPTLPGTNATRPALTSALPAGASRQIASPAKPDDGLASQAPVPATPSAAAPSMPAPAMPAPSMPIAAAPSMPAPSMPAPAVSLASMSPMMPVPRPPALEEALENLAPAVPVAYAPAIAEPPIAVAPHAMPEPHPGHAPPVAAAQPVHPMFPVRRDATPRMAFHERTHAEPVRRKRSNGSLAGWLILLVAMIIASLIVATGMWISSERTREERDRRLRERYEEIQRREQAREPTP
jgi:hypothetical protein